MAIAGELPFNPSVWTSEKALFKYAACYEYIVGDTGMLLQIATLTCTPGQLGGVILGENELNISNLIKAKEADGLVWTGLNMVITPGTYPAAFFYSDSDYFHYARRNPDGTWSQKFLGEKPRIVTDKQGRPIQEFKKGDNLEGFAFVGYMLVSRQMKMAHEKMEQGMKIFAQKAFCRERLTNRMRTADVKDIYNDTVRQRMTIERMLDRKEQLIIPQA